MFQVIESLKQALAHAFHRLRHPPEFITFIERDRRRQILLGDAPCRLRQARQRPDHPAAQDQDDHRRRYREHQRQLQQALAQAALVLRKIGRKRHAHKHPPDPLSVVFDELLPPDDQRVPVGRPVDGNEGLAVGFLDDADRNETLVVRARLHDGFGIAVGKFPERCPQRGRQHPDVPPQVGLQRCACPLLERQALDGVESQARNQESQHDSHEHDNLQAATGPTANASSSAPTALAAV